MKLDGVSALALVVIASFAIDRIVNAFLFLLDFARVLRDPAFEKDKLKRKRIEQRNRLIYFLLAGTLGILVLGYYGDIRILHAMGFEDISPRLDIVITGLLLMGGAEQVGKLADIPGVKHGEAEEQRPIEVTGTLKLEGDAGDRVMGQGR